MFDWIRSWFGRGRVKVEWSGIGPKGIQSGTAKCPYTGVYNEESVLKHFRDEIRYQYDIVVTDIRVIAHVEE